MTLPEEITNHRNKNKKFRKVFENSAHGIDMLLYLFGKLDIQNISKIKLNSFDSGRIVTFINKNKHTCLLIINSNSPSNFSLKSRYQCKVGYSGHETGVAISCAAAAFGISSLERHITLDRSMYGSDQSASLEPRGLRELIGSVRKIEQALGDGIKKFLPAEEKVSEKLRAHLSNI